jgi:hypothetical protein
MAIPFSKESILKSPPSTYSPLEVSKMRIAPLLLRTSTTIARVFSGGIVLVPFSGVVQVIVGLQLPQFV